MNSARNRKRKESELLPVCSRPAHFPTAQVCMNAQEPFVGDHSPDEWSPHFCLPQNATKYIHCSERSLAISTSEHKLETKKEIYYFHQCSFSLAVFTVLVQTRLPLPSRILI